MPPLENAHANRNCVEKVVLPLTSTASFFLKEKGRLIKNREKKPTILDKSELLGPPPKMKNQRPVLIKAVKKVLLV